MAGTESALHAETAPHMPRSDQLVRRLPADPGGAPGWLLSRTMRRRRSARLRTFSTSHSKRSNLTSAANTNKPHRIRDFILLSGFGAQHAREMAGILAAQFSGVIADLFEQEPAAGHLTMCARRRLGGLLTGLGLDLRSASVTPPRSSQARRPVCSRPLRPGDSRSAGPGAAGHRRCG
jgi:hypothetical protein